MAYRGYRVLAVVPARGGSKGIPRKNLRRVGGMTLVGRAGAIVAALPWLDGAVVSTDDREIAEEAVRNHLSAPFLRPAALSDDAASSDDTWRHAWLEAERHYGVTFDISILLEPTSPLRRAEDVTRTVDMLIGSGSPSAITVSPTPDHYAPEKLFVLRDGRLEFYCDAGRGIHQRQQLPAYHNRNGVCYAMWRMPLMNNEPIIGADCAVVVIDRPVVNIDDIFELDLADWMLAREAAEARADTRNSKETMP